MSHHLHADPAALRAARVAAEELRAALRPEALDPRDLAVLTAVPGGAVVSVEHDRLLDRVHEIAALVNRNAPLAVRGTRLAIKRSLDLPLHEAEILAETFRERVVRTDDAKEGPAAFLEKRPPKWTAS